MTDKKMNEIHDTASKILYGAIKIIVHITVLIISALLTINMFRSFSSIELYKTLWTILGATIEAGKIYLYVLAIAHFKRAEEYDRFKSIIMFIIYAGLAIVSYQANSGFAMVSIQNQSKTAEIQNDSSSVSLIDLEIKQLNEEIEIIKINRLDAMNTKREYPQNWVTRRSEQQVIIDDYSKDIEIKNARINEISLSKKEVADTGITQESKSSDIFELIGAGKIEGDTVMLYLMRFIAILLEALTIFTAGTYPLKKTEEDIVTTSTVIKVTEEKPEEENIIPERTNTLLMTINKEEMFKYIDVLMEEGMQKLKNDTYISEKLGLPLATCKTYRKTLLSMSYDNKNLISSKRGVGTNANFMKKTIKQLIDIDQKLKR